MDSLLIVTILLMTIVVALIVSNQAQQSSLIKNLTENATSTTLNSITTSTVKRGLEFTDLQDAVDNLTLYIGLSFNNRTIEHEELLRDIVTIIQNITVTSEDINDLKNDTGRIMTTLSDINRTLNIIVNNSKINIIVNNSKTTSKP